MESTAMVARRFRLQEWTEQIKSCNNRPHGITVEEWCNSNGITKANYYYRLKQVRHAYLKCMQQPETETAIIPVPAVAMMTEAPANPQKSLSDSLKIYSKGFSLTVTNSTPLELLGKVLKVIADA